MAETELTRPPTITERLAEHATGLGFDDLPDRVIEKAKAHLWHHLGTAFRGCRLENGQQAVRVARELSGADGQSDGQCSIVGEPRKVHLLDAVFANAFLMHCAGMDDFLLPPGANPGVVTNPVAWAFGETTRASGRDLLTAVVVGYDVLSALSNQELTFGREEYHPAKHVFAPFAAAATAARLLHLSYEQTVHAFGHAGQVGRNGAERGDHVWAMHPLMARNGAMTAMLGKAGMPASPTVLEGKHGLFRLFFSQAVPESVQTNLATLGTEFAITRAEVKRQPVSALNLVPIELTQQLRRNHALRPSDVATVDVVLPEERRARETKRDNAVMSTRAGRTPRFLVAMALADGSIDPTRFEEPPDADLRPLLDKIRLQYETGHPLLYARVEVTTTRGDHYAAAKDVLDLPPPVDQAEWLAEGGRHVVSDEQLARLNGLIRQLEDVPDVSDVMACVVSGAPT